MNFFGYSCNDLEIDLGQSFSFSIQTVTDKERDLAQISGSTEEQTEKYTSD